MKYLSPSDLISLWSNSKEEAAKDHLNHYSPTPNYELIAELVSIGKKDFFKNIPPTYKKLFISQGFLYPHLSPSCAYNNAELYDLVQRHIGLYYKNIIIKTSIEHRRLILELPNFREPPSYYSSYGNERNKLCMVEKKVITKIDLKFPYSISIQIDDTNLNSESEVTRKGLISEANAIKTLGFKGFIQIDQSILDKALTEARSLSDNLDIPVQKYKIDFRIPVEKGMDPKNPVSSLLSLL